MSTDNHGPQTVEAKEPATKASVEEIIRKRLEDERERLMKDMQVAIPVAEQFDRPVERDFTRAEREHTTILFGGLTWKHEQLIHGALERPRLQVEPLPTPDVAAFQLGKEYGNNGQCNPTYFTVGNLVQYLQKLESEGMSRPEIIDELRLLHRRRVRPLPLRHVRGRVPPRAAQLRLRRLPRPALPAVRRAQPVRGRAPASR